ncbi:hypothetical protein NS303_12800 [Pantoea ananatis]|nr:hypothetical protein NS303_12800 [Pantoea ananatis]KTR54577.1 hypothetical protein NS311_15580 [Pantoea ananatis]KTR65241.1 hypothetical protein RSA47_10080 [Pantoea ananatis]KTR72540.1 hypothetical protein NS296_02745 [Pantoea ananatis]
MNFDLVHMFFAVCWIAMLFFTFVFFYVLVKWALFTIWPVKSIKINHFHNGRLLESRVVNLSSDEYFVRQLRGVSKESKGE